MDRHLVLCGGAKAHPGETGTRNQLERSVGPEGVNLQIERLERTIGAGITSVLQDLLDIAAYVYAADSVIKRGGARMRKMGEDWHRHFKLVIPVSHPDIWSSSAIHRLLVETLSFLADDTYDLRFEPITRDRHRQGVFDFAEDAGVTPDEVILFSGGLDSFAGAIADTIGNGRRIALVTHRSASTITSAQQQLLAGFAERVGPSQMMQVPVRLTLPTGTTKERTHRTRSFLYACLGFVVAKLFGKDRLRFYENGVLSLHLPISAQLLGARATRSTHPKALQDMSALFSAIAGRAFTVDNPFIWKTKTEVVELIIKHGCGDLIPLTRSCADVRNRTIKHPHCGVCSQCIDRRFATLAAGATDTMDPDGKYQVRLLDGERTDGDNISMLASYVCRVTEIEQLDDGAFFATFGEATRVFQYLDMSASEAGRKIYELSRRHALSVCRVLDDAIGKHSVDLRRGVLAENCLLRLATNVRRERAIRAVPDLAKAPVVLPAIDPSTLEADGRAWQPQVFIAFDDEKKRVEIQGIGELKGTDYRLLESLRNMFFEDRSEPRAKERFRALQPADLARHLGVQEPSIRRYISRINQNIATLCEKRDLEALPDDAIVENLRGQGYRLNPFRVEIVGPTDIKRGHRPIP